MLNTVCNLCKFNCGEKCMKKSINYTTEDGCYKFEDEDEDIRN